MPNPADPSLARCAALADDVNDTVTATLRFTTCTSRPEKPSLTLDVNTAESNGVPTTTRDVAPFSEGTTKT